MADATHSAPSAPLEAVASTVRGDDRLDCRAWIKAHSRSFYLSSLLLPRDARHAAWALYAFCRRADDAVDDLAAAPDPTSDGLRRVEALRARLEAAYADASLDDPIDRAFSRVAARYHIPRALPEALLAGMEMDARGAAYQSDDDLLLYCFRVAATVGLMMTRVMGCAADVAYLRAADLGVAMQLTNIARDVGEDARRGRVYLPASLCAEVGLDPRLLATAAVAPPAARLAVARLLERADAHYRAADLGVPLLPRGCRLAIASSRRIYAAIGDAIRRRGCDSVAARAYVPLGRKLRLVIAAGTALLAGPRATTTSGGPADTRLAPLVRQVGLPA
jgi:phytoene synthase